MRRENAVIPGGPFMKKTDIHATHRELEILEALRSLGGSARTSALAQALSVSEETVRRTVRALTTSGLVQRVHGGVYLRNSDAVAPVTSRLGKQSAEKARIAATAAGFVADGACVFLDVGSTTAYVADRLRDHSDLTVVTNALHAAQALMGRNRNRVFLAGGQLGEIESGTFGPDAMAFIDRFSIEVAILSVDGIDADSGFLLAGSAEADLARAVIARSRRKIVVADHSKFGQGAPMVICPPEQIDMIVTDRPLKPLFQNRVEAWECEVVTAPAE